MQLTDIQLQQLKNKLLDTYKLFSRFCEENSISFFACAGTAIGGIRHSGFIPWDDDIDLMMMRPDYEKLRSLRHKLKSEHNISLFFPGDDKYWLSYGKIGVPNTTFFSNWDWTLSIGLSIDIFPYDEIGDDDNLSQTMVSKFKKLWYRYQLSIKNYRLEEFVKLLKGCHLRTFTEHLLGFLIYRKISKRLFKRWEKYESKIVSVKGDNVITYSGYWSLKREKHEKKWFSDKKMIKFEDTVIPVVKDYDSYLRTLYGDYMTPPPIDKQHTTHSCLYIDLERNISFKEVQSLLNNK